MWTKSRCCCRNSKDNLETVGDCRSTSKTWVTGDVYRCDLQRVFASSFSASDHGWRRQTGSRGYLKRHSSARPPGKRKHPPLCIYREWLFEFRHSLPTAGLRCEWTPRYFCVREWEI